MLAGELNDARSSFTWQPAHLATENQLDNGGHRDDAVARHRRFVGQEEPYMIGGWRESSEARLAGASAVAFGWELCSLISSLSSLPGLK